MYCLGIDTSNYTTSLAVVNDKSELIFETRKILDVPEGHRGLRQSDAHFQHISNLPVLLSECFSKISPKEIACLCASNKPRRIEGSYMPVFTAGVNTAKLLGLSLGIPVFEVSHQENHIIAGMWSSAEKFERFFLAYHISGGTTELLQVACGERLEIMQIGGSSDLKAGQFIDRVGVAMGLKFPCGQEMDKLSLKHGSKALSVPVGVDGSCASFSGPESFIQRLLSRGGITELQKCEISRGVFECIAKSIEQSVLNASNGKKNDKLLIVGGVASNRIIREYLEGSKALRKADIKVVFSDAAYSSDNAVGTALCGMKQFLNNVEE